VISRVSRGSSSGLEDGQADGLEDGWADGLKDGQGVRWPIKLSWKMIEHRAARWPGKWSVTLPNGLGDDRSSRLMAWEMIKHRAAGWPGWWSSIRPPHGLEDDWLSRWAGRWLVKPMAWNMVKPPDSLLSRLLACKMTEAPNSLENDWGVHRLGKWSNSLMSWKMIKPSVCLEIIEPSDVLESDRAAVDDPANGLEDGWFDDSLEDGWADGLKDSRTEGLEDGWADDLPKDGRTDGFKYGARYWPKLSSKLSLPVPCFPPNIDHNMTQILFFSTIFITMANFPVPNRQRGFELFDNNDLSEEFHSSCLALVAQQEVCSNLSLASANPSPKKNFAQVAYIQCLLAASKTEKYCIMGQLTQAYYESKN
jgi:hypothetical protein